MKTKTEYIRLLRQYMTENASKYGISSMGIFGSVASGESTEQSDIEVYVEGNRNGFFALSGMKAD